MYQYKTVSMYGTKNNVFIRNNPDGSVTSFGEYVDNIDYHQFKTQVANGVQLEDPDGNVMTQDQVNAFLKEIP